MRILSMFLFLILAIGCKNSGHPSSTKKDSDTLEMPSGALAAKLYQNYVQNATLQDDIDQNLLIEYAVDKNLNVTRTKSGLYYIIHEKGSGPLLDHTEKLSVDYQGAFLDGQVFDSSYERGEPLEFKIGQMIMGWNEGLRYLRHGSKATFLIPSKLAYGSRGFEGFVPPNKALVFDIEVH